MFVCVTGECSMGWTDARTLRNLHVGEESRCLQLPGEHISTPLLLSPLAWSACALLPLIAIVTQKLCKSMVGCYLAHPSCITTCTFPGVLLISVTTAIWLSLFHMVLRKVLLFNVLSTELWPSRLCYACHYCPHFSRWWGFLAPAKGPLIGMCGLVLSSIWVITIAFQVVSVFSVLVFYHGKIGLLPSLSAIFFLRILMHSYNYINIKQIVALKSPCNWVTDAYDWIHLNTQYKTEVTIQGPA